MTWLLRLYPPMWRRRYAAEVAEMLAGRGFSLRIAIDLIAGAIDTWLHPSATLAAAVAASPTPEGRNMLSKVLRLDCSGFYGPDVTRADHWRASVTTIVLTLILTLAWMGLHFRVGDNAYVDALSPLPFLFALNYSMRYTFLKGRPASVQAVFIGGSTLVVTAILLAAGWVAAQL